MERYTLSVINGKVEVPASFNVGVSYRKGINWMTGTQFFYQDWSSFKSVNKDDEGLGIVEVSFGGEYTIDPNTVENYLKRITFRQD